MAIIPLLRTTVFSLAIVFALVVLGICAHIQWLISPVHNPVSLSFSAFGIAAASVTVVSLPLMLFLGIRRRGVFTSMIVFEIVWCLVLWVLWIAAAGDTAADRTYYFPDGCVFQNYPTTNQICMEFTVVEAFAFLIFLSVFVYYDVLLLYAIINAVRGKSIWTVSVKEANAITSSPNTAIPLNQPQHNTIPAAHYQNFTPNAPPSQQPYNAYPQQISAQSPVMAPQQNHPYDHAAASGAPQLQPNYGGYSPNAPSPNSAPLPPTPNYTSYPVNGSQSQLPLHSGYQAQQQPYASHQYNPA
ncbi:hypothetical protein PAXRUDRAFT_11145 [Paxillus rubicundulus Ve08.2h10]|uniref:MARVEL domain-containing protein n=1 Tax=Paxillus rubicundulus Ve08.2h10 TaxID=930991 RepID=A0A0D0E4A8_9AGAM|nr:hypothetical protein PAXRUDRAFT_11145 [Paxillus rubicundulus Ve08.2h10]